MRDIIDLAHPADGLGDRERRAGRIGIRRAGNHAFHIGGEDGAGLHRIDPHPVLLARAVERDALGQGHHRRLGGVVGGQIRRGLVARRAREVDDGTPAAFRHQRDRRLAAHEDRIDVDRVAAAEILRRNVGNRSEHRDRGIVDQHVEPPVGGFDLADHVLPARPVGDVLMDVAAAQLRRRGAACRLVDIGDDHRGPLRQQRLRRRLAETHRAARQQHHLARNPSCHCTLPDCLSGKRVKAGRDPPPLPNLGRRRSPSSR